MSALSLFRLIIYKEPLLMIFLASSSGVSLKSNDFSRFVIFAHAPAAKIFPNLRYPRDRQVRVRQGAPDDPANPP
jgi:hypothetical protein